MRPFWNGRPLVVAVAVALGVLLLGGWSPGTGPALTSVSTPAPAAAPAPSPAPPPKSVPVDGHELGGVDLNGYCRAVGYDGAKLVNNTPYGWVCFNNGNDQMSSLTVNDACQWQYSWDDVAVPPGNNDPNAWRCWSVG